MSASPVLWTIGHSDLAFDAFARLLAAERIEFVVDVRSHPYSRHVPHFNREPLHAALRQAGMGYVFLGEELGGRPSRAEHYDAEGHAMYGEMAQERGFRGAVDRLLRGAKKHRVALLCSEADPNDCHRRLLVGKVLADSGAELRHILRDGGVLVEHSVEIGSAHAPTLFGDEAQRWRSTRSVSRSRRLSTSSAG